MERQVALDGLKLLLALMVVALHASFLSDISDLGKALTVNGLFRIAVPVFLLINGYFFYSVLRNGAFALWLKRVLLLYAFWMLVYAPLWVNIPDLSIGTFARLVHKILFGYHHLWYVAGMIGAGVLLWLLRDWSEKALVCLSLILFSAGVVIQYLGNYYQFFSKYLDQFFSKYFDQFFSQYLGMLPESAVSAADQLFNAYWVHRNFLFFSFPFFCLGYLIHRYRIAARISFPMLLAGTFAGVVLLGGEVLLNFGSSWNQGGFDNYASLVVVCPLLLMLTMCIQLSGPGKLMALYSASIYFIHVWVLELLRWTTELSPTPLTFWALLLAVLVSFPVIRLHRRFSFIL